MNEEFVTITKSEYDRLLDDSKFLKCLEDNGVYNWEGYDFAIDMYEVNDVQ